MGYVTTRRFDEWPLARQVVAETRLFSVREAATQAHCGLHALYGAIREGKLRAYRVRGRGKRNIFIRCSDLARYLDLVGEEMILPADHPVHKTSST